MSESATAGVGGSFLFYVGAGFGLKRLYGTSDSDFDLKYIPTIRIINIGYAF